MLRVRTSLDGDCGPLSTATKSYRNLDEAVHDVARAAGSILTDDIIAGRDDISIKLVVQSEESAEAVTIEVSATVIRRGPQTADDGSDRLLEV